MEKYFFRYDGASLTVAPAIFEKLQALRETVFTIRTTREGGRLELTDANMSHRLRM